jgi:hypothetical protein
MNMWSCLRGNPSGNYRFPTPTARFGGPEGPALRRGAFFFAMQAQES